MVAHDTEKLKLVLKESLQEEMLRHENLAGYCILDSNKPIRSKSTQAFSASSVAQLRGP